MYYWQYKLHMKGGKNNAKLDLNPSLSARKRKLSGFLFCIRRDENTRVGVRNRRSRLPKQESLSPQEKGSYQASFFVLEGMRTPEWGFVIDEVACQSKNSSLSARNQEQQKLFLISCKGPPKRDGQAKQSEANSNSRLPAKRRYSSFCSAFCI